MTALKIQEDAQHIKQEMEDSVGIITMARPGRFNALDVQMSRDLRRAALQFAREPEVRAVILKGTEKVFCSGADLKYIRELGRAEDLGYLMPEACKDEAGYGACFKEILEYLHSTISEIRRAPKPFIAAVQGVAAAGGFGLAMSCDIVFASDRASFEWAYGKTALTGAESSTFLLPRLVGLRKSFELAFLNPRLDARQASQAGLITDVFPDSQFDSSVLSVAKRLASGPTDSFAVTKQLINSASGMDLLDAHLDMELVRLTDSADRADFAEGLDAFFARRQPRFEGGQE